MATLESPDAVRVGVRAPRLQIATVINATWTGRRAIAVIYKIAEPGRAALHPRSRRPRLHHRAPLRPRLRPTRIDMRRLLLPWLKMVFP